MAFSNSIFLKIRDSMYCQFSAEIPKDGKLYSTSYETYKIRSQYSS